MNPFTKKVIFLVKVSAIFLATLLSLFVFLRLGGSFLYVELIVLYVSLFFGLTFWFARIVSGNTKAMGCALAALITAGFALRVATSAQLLPLLIVKAESVNDLNRTLTQTTRGQIWMIVDDVEWATEKRSIVLDSKGQALTKELLKQLLEEKAAVKSEINPRHGYYDAVWRCVGVYVVCSKESGEGTRAMKSESPRTIR